MTKLGRFMERRRIKPAVLAREAGVSRQALLRLRRRPGNPRRWTMIRIARASSDITSKRVTVEMLFSLR
jgi:DNA-binding phage protein